MVIKIRIYFYLEPTYLMLNIKSCNNAVAYKKNFNKNCLNSIIIFSKSL